MIIGLFCKALFNIAVEFTVKTKIEKSNTKTENRLSIVSPIGTTNNEKFIYCYDNCILENTKKKKT